MHVTHTRKFTRNILRLRRRQRQRRSRIDKLLRALDRKTRVARVAAIIGSALCWANVIYSMTPILRASPGHENTGSEEAECMRVRAQSAFFHQSEESLGGADVSST